MDTRVRPALTNSITPPHVMTRQHFAHLGNHLILPARKLRRAGLAPFLVGGNRGGRPGALDQILDLHFAARLLVRALNDHAGRIAPVGVFELVAHVPGIAEIELGADFFGAQGRDHLLIVGDAVAVEYGDDHGTEFLRGVELAEHRQRGLQPRYADRKTGRRHRLAAKARHQPVVTPAAADRAEAHGPAFFVFGVEQQFYFVDRAGVIFEPAHDGGIDADPIFGVARRLY